MNSAYGKPKNNEKSFKLFSTKNFLLLQKENLNEGNHLKVFNVTEIGFEEQDQEGFQVTIQDHKIANDSKFIYGIQKNNMQSSFITVIESDYSNPTSSLNLYELVVPQKSQSDFFSNLRFPMF